MKINREQLEAAARDFRLKLREPTTDQLIVQVIKHAVCVKYGVRERDLDSRRKFERLAFARHVAMYLMRRFTGFSYQRIGRCFGGRDHGTVIHAVWRIQNQSGFSKGDATDIEELINSLGRLLGACGATAHA